MATLQQILTTAAAEIGYAEEPVNRTKYGRHFKSDGAQWCGLFVMWVFAKQNHRFPNTAYTPNGVRAWKSRGVWHKDGSIKPGDVIYFDFPNDGISRVSHVGLAVHEFDNGDVLTIEGNTSGDVLKSGDERNGGEVALKRRPRSYIVGWGRPTYKPGELTAHDTILKQYRDAQDKPAKPKPAKKAKTDGTSK